MTILEAIQSNPVFSNLEENTIQYALDSRTVDGTAIYTQSSLNSVELISADLYMLIVISPDIKEGQLAIKYDSSELKRRALSIYKKYNDLKLEDYKPRIIDVGVTAVDA